MRTLAFVCSTLLLAGGVSAAKADTCSTASNLITNCGFETGTFSGWSGSSTTDATGNFNGVVTGDPYQGNDAAYLGAATPEYTGPTTLSQTFSTKAGQQYTIQFALDNSFSGGTSYPNSFAVNFGGSTLLSETNAVASSYALYTYGAAATGSSTTLSFLSFNDDGYFDLDDVSVIATPTPTPEPSSLLLLGTGVLGGLSMLRRRYSA